MCISIFQIARGNTTCTNCMQDIFKRKVILLFHMKNINTFNYFGFVFDNGILA